MKKLYYTLAYIILLGVPSYFLYDSSRINTKALAITIILVFIVGIIFDTWAVRHGKKDKFFVWQYNEGAIIGLKIYGVPVEDYFLFFILTPIFIISLYKFIEKMLS